MKCMHGNDENVIIDISNTNYNTLISEQIQFLNQHETNIKHHYSFNKESTDQTFQTDYTNYCDVNSFIRVIINYYVLFTPFSIIGKVNHNVNYALQFISAEHNNNKPNTSFTERLHSIIDSLKSKMTNMNVQSTEQANHHSSTNDSKGDKSTSELSQITSLVKKVSFGYHKGKVTQIILLQNKRLCSCSEDNTIIIYTSKYEVALVISTPHVNGINSIVQLDNGNIVSCSNDRSIRAFDLKSGRSVSSVTKAHNEYIIQLKNLSGSSFASASLDGNVNIWDNKLSKLKCIQHQTSVKFVFFSQSKKCLLCGLHNFNLFIWNVDSEKQLAKFEYVHSYHPEGVLEYCESTIIIGGSNVLTIIDLNTLQIERTVKINYNFSTMIYARNKYIIAGIRKEGMFISNDQLCVLDLTNFNSRIEIDAGHTDNINALVKLNDKACATCSDDGLIIIWKY